MKGNWADKIDELESENYDLTQKNTHLEDEIAELIYQNDYMKDRLEIVKDELTTAQANALYWKKDRAEEAEADLEASRALARDLVAELDELRAERDAMTRRAISAEDRSEDLENERDAARGRAEMYFADIQALESQLDELVKEKEQVELQRDDLRSELEYLYEITENESEDYYLTAGRIEELESAWFEEFIRANLTQARANSWFEIAKINARARNFWMDQADEWADKAIENEANYDELKAALRTLGNMKG